MKQFSNLNASEKKELLDLLELKKKQRDENQLAHYQAYKVQKNSITQSLRKSS